MALPILYSFRRCPYAMRARLAIVASGQTCALREVVLRNKPAALLTASPKGTVPVLMLPDGTVLEQSLDIMLWALRRHDPGQWLAPDMDSEAEMLALIAECDGPFKQALDRCKYPERHPDTDTEAQRAAASRWLVQLDSRLAATAHLFGSHHTLADMAIAPFVRQFAAIDSGWWAAQPWPHLQAWLARWLGSPLLAQCMQKYPAWQEGSPGVPFPAPLPPSAATSQT